MPGNKQVAVLLCTYNGEKYIREQVDSILSQSYRDIRLYIQDDHSTDGTWNVLQRYSDDPRVTLYKKEDNLGYPECFYDLMSKVDAADYYAFSDQDDVWEKEKMERAVRLLRDADPQKPALVFANYVVCDENLSPIRTSKGPDRAPDFLYSLYSCLGLGFTYVLNHTAKQLIAQRRSVKNVTKDAWIGMCCTAFGSAYFDAAPEAFHRRNSGAFSAQDTTWLQIQKDRVRKFLLGSGLNQVYSVMEEFYQMFEGELPEQHKKELRFFLDRGLLHRFRKVFYPRRLRYDLGDDIMLRVMFALGKL